MICFSVYPIPQRGTVKKRQKQGEKKKPTLTLTTDKPRSYQKGTRKKKKKIDLKF